MSIPDYEHPEFGQEQLELWLDMGLLHSKCCAALMRGHPPRCTGCGHRQALGTYVPRQTREQPFWTWPGELIGRWRARHNGLL